MLRGRIDKKYCDDYCRSAYNNKLYQHDRSLNFMRRVNNILRKNRRILEELMLRNEEVSKISRSKLLKKGFNFNCFTSAYATAEGGIYYFCYEYGYQLKDSEWCYVTKRKEAMK
jgi:hypothetical protein